MEVFAHIKTVVSIVLGLGIGTLLNGTARFIQHPNRTKPYWIHLLWAFYIFLTLVHFWWWEYKLRLLSEWTFVEYFFLIIYIVFYFLLCQLLFPTDVKDFDNNYKNYFYSRKKWFFSILALIYVNDFFDTLIKGQEYYNHVMPMYGIRMVSHFIVCVFFAFTKSKSPLLYGSMVIFFILFEMYYIASLYYINT